MTIDLAAEHDTELDIDPATRGADADWPAGALAAAERAFGYLTIEPHPLAVDGRAVGYGLPARHIPLDELRQLLVHDPDTTFDAKDAAWHELIHRARDWGPAWVIAAVGMALPALAVMSRRLCTGHTGQSEDIDAELLAGFLDALRHRDLTGPAPYIRMCWAGWRAALLVRTSIATGELPDVFDPASRQPARPYGHPDLILGRAVHAGIIDADQAELISATRLGRVLIEDLAARAGVDPSVIRMRRRRAELALVRALATRDLERREPGTLRRRAAASAAHIAGPAGHGRRTCADQTGQADMDRPVANPGRNALADGASADRTAAVPNPAARPPAQEGTGHAIQ
jgi:hypothetical protein